MQNETHFIEIYKNVKENIIVQSFINEIIYLEDYLHSTIISENLITIAIFKIKPKK
jgi:hypothetical protein